MNLCADAAPAPADLRYGGSTAAADDFVSALGRIEAAVLDSCDERLEWPARVAAGIATTIDFLVADPAAARTLALDSRFGGDEGDAGYAEMIGRFAGLLGAGAPRSVRLPASSDRSVVSVIAAVVGRHVRAGTVDSLGKADPDLVFLALLPYLGFAEASRWSGAPLR